MNVLPTHSLLFLLFDVQRSDSLFTGSNFFPSLLGKFPNYNNKKKKLFFLSAYPCFLPLSFLVLLIIAKSSMVILELQEIYLCLLKDFYRSPYRQREPETKVCFKQNGVRGLLPQQGGTTLECTVMNLIQR